jgi:hypothetical protein
MPAPLSSKKLKALRYFQIHLLAFIIYGDRLHLFCSEFDFRYNTGKVEDGTRAATLIGRIVGKRLFYRD